MNDQATPLGRPLVWRHMAAMHVHLEFLTLYSCFLGNEYMRGEKSQGLETACLVAGLTGSAG